MRWLSDGGRTQDGGWSSGRNGLGLGSLRGRFARGWDRRFRKEALILQERPDDQFDETMNSFRVLCTVLVEFKSNRPQKGLTSNSMTRFSGSRVTSIMPGGALRLSTNIGCCSFAFLGLFRDVGLSLSWSTRWEFACRAKDDVAKSTLTSLCKGEEDSGRWFTSAQPMSIKQSIRERLRLTDELLSFAVSSRKGDEPHGTERPAIVFPLLKLDDLLHSSSSPELPPSAQDTLLRPGDVDQTSTRDCSACGIVECESYLRMQECNSSQGRAERCDEGELS
jgi:hypothetical protein